MSTVRDANGLQQLLPTVHSARRPTRLSTDVLCTFGAIRLLTLELTVSPQDINHAESIKIGVNEDRN